MMNKVLLSYIFLLVQLAFVDEVLAKPKHQLGAGTVVVDEAIELVKDKYVYEVSSEKLIDGALLGLMRVVDQYSDYLSPSDFEEFKSSINGAVYGIGIEFGKRGEDFVIVSVVPNSPASAAGFMPSDVILSVDGVSCENMSMAGVTNAIRGPEGVVEIKVGRVGADGKRAKIRLTPKRGKVVVKPVYAVVRHDVIFARISSFSAEAYSSFLTEIRNFVKSRKGIVGMVLDLRDNPGGLLEQAVDIAGLMLPPYAPIVTVKTKNEDGVADFVANDAEDLLEGRPIVVLTNENTSSAAEILSSAWQENNRAVVVGTNTYGKGSVQDTFSLISLPGAAIKLTFAVYETPLGNPMEGRGVRPDLEFSQPSAKGINPLVLHEEKIGQEAMKIILDKSTYANLMATPNHPPVDSKIGKATPDDLKKKELKNSFLMSWRSVGVNGGGLFVDPLSLSFAGKCAYNRSTNGLRFA